MLKLFRPKNLIFLAATQLLMYYAVVVPILQKYGLEAMLPAYCVWMIIFATALIAGGGYVINDYFDIKIDRINRPESVIVGETISKKAAMRLYIAVTAVGVLLGLAASVLVGSTSLGFIFVVVPGMLWFYSSSYKRQFLVGNIIVSLSCALSIFLPLIAENALLTATYGDLLLATPIQKELYTWVSGYAVFAFMITWVREVIKDIEDMEGDRQVECRTLPIVWGERRAKGVATALFAISLVAMFLIDWLWIELPERPFFTIFSPANLFILFFAIFLTMMYSKPNPKYHAISGLLKIFMAVGVFYSLLFYYVLAQTYKLTFFGLFRVV